jgi:uncharacterized protein YycO
VPNIPPLSQGNASRSITPSTLQAGDIIVSTTDSRISRAIRHATASPVSHALLYIGNGEVVEAVREGVVVRSLQEALDDASLGVVYRTSMEPEQILTAITTAASHEGANYDYLGAILSPSEDLCGVLSSDGRFFCSELVVEALDEAGIDLTGRSPECSTPNDIVLGNTIANSEYLGHIVTDNSPHDLSIIDDVGINEISNVEGAAGVSNYSNECQGLSDQVNNVADLGDPTVQSSLDVSSEMSFSEQMCQLEGQSEGGTSYEDSSGYSQSINGLSDALSSTGTDQSMLPETLLNEHVIQPWEEQTELSADYQSTYDPSEQVSGFSDTCQSVDVAQDAPSEALFSEQVSHAQNGQFEANASHQESYSGFSDASSGSASGAEGGAAATANSGGSVP